MSLPETRLARTFLTATGFTTARQVVRALGAVQAQDYEGAKWGIAQRATGLRDADLDGDFDQGRLLRTHILRPTWHLVDPVDIRWLLALTAPHVKRTMATYDRQLGLDEPTFRQSRSALERALRDRDFLTRTEIKAVLLRARVGPLGVQQTAHLLMRAELDGLIVSGPRRGKQFTYALLDERVLSTPLPDRDWSLRELALRYFRTRGPATASDFSWWSGLRMPDVTRAVEASRDALDHADVRGTRYFDGGGAVPRRRPSAHLLPNYDEFFIGYRDRSAIGQRLGTVNVVTGGSAQISNVVVVNGQLVGGWRRTVRQQGVRLNLRLATSLTPAERSRVQRAVRRYEAFLDMPVRVEWFPVRRLHHR
ncbi:MAG: winged helix DNA-binding domain-containing protein [Gemmatimonadaceae bacterium]|nr:winged helix DNA-binding domain-containing protein [Gemmatimonadaceae bacterium]